MALLALSLGVLAGCGGSSGGGGGSATPTAGAAAATLPAGVKATGSPVRIGFISAEGGSAVSLPEVREGAEAAVSYANDHLGGIAGHPIEMVACKSKEDPASARTCGNQMVEDKVDAVVVGTTGFGDSIVPVVTAAGIPYVSVSGNSASEITNDKAFSWSGAFIASLGGIAEYARQQKYTSMALFVTDVPAATAGARALGAPLFTKAGVKLDIVPIPTGTPDVTSQVTTAVGKKPQAVALVGEGTFCTAVLKGLQAVGTKLPTMVIQPCVTKSVADAVPGGLDGMKNVTDADTDSDDPDSALYRTVMATYQPNTATNGYSVTGYQGMLGLVRALSGMTGEVTPAAILAKIRTAKDVVLPAGHGVTFTCNGKVVALFKGLCSANSLVGTIKGTSTGDYTLLNPSGLLTP